MSVKLISVTPNAEKTILSIARVSSDQTNEKTGLIKYLLRNEHWSPFEMAHMTVEINTSRAIAPQILRHRSFSFQEFSQRYAAPDGSVKYRARRQAEKNRQSSIDDMDQQDIDWFYEAQDIVEQECRKLYDMAVEQGIAKECARVLLPLGTKTKLYMSGSLRSFIHYINLRTQEDTQLEHRFIAEMIRQIFIKEFPIISEALGWV